MVVICFARDTIGYDRRRSELSNAALHITYESNSIEN